MPRRSYRIYLDSTVLSQATDPKVKGADADASRVCLRMVRDYCTLVYSPMVLIENGPARSALPHLARRRLWALRGKNAVHAHVPRWEVECAAGELLRLAKRADEDKSSSLVRDARHAAYALLAGADALVTGNTSDFHPSNGTLGKHLSEWADARYMNPPQIVSPSEACALIAENPPRLEDRPMSYVSRKLYARQQYWSMRECGIPRARARRYIERKWEVRL